MSGSVAAFSRFTLDLLVALDARLNQVAGVLLRGRGRGHHRAGTRGAGAGGAAERREAARDAGAVGGSSDYGYVMRQFARESLRGLTRRSVVLVVRRCTVQLLRSGAGGVRGDRRASTGRVYWLNPEPRRFWNEGDSVIARYEPLHAWVRECRTLRQIARFVSRWRLRQRELTGDLLLQRLPGDRYAELQDQPDARAGSGQQFGAPRAGRRRRSTGRRACLPRPCRRLAEASACAAVLVAATRVWAGLSPWKIIRWISARRRHSSLPSAI
jgi:hypothetical protein